MAVSSVTTEERPRARRAAAAVRPSAAILPTAATPAAVVAPRRSHSAAVPRRSSPLLRSLVFVVVALAGCNPADKLLLWPPSGPAEPNGAVRRVVDDGVEVWTMPRD